MNSIHKDIASGKNEARDGFQQLKADIAAKKIDVVLVYRLDRLSRNVRDIYDFLDSIKHAGVAFVSITEGFDTTTAMGRAMLGVAAVFAQLTREMISENTRDGLMRRVEAGFHPGSFLYGYEYSKELGHYLFCEGEAEVVRQIFSLYTDDKWGTEKIARMLNLRGVRTRTDTEWHGATIGVMLQNVAYAGRVESHGSVRESSPTNQSNIVSQKRSIAVAMATKGNNTLDKPGTELGFVCIAYGLAEQTR